MLSLWGVSTALNNALARTANEYAGSRYHKRTVIVFSDGVENSSTLKISSVMGHFANTDCRIYALGLREFRDDYQEYFVVRASGDIESVTRKTGGYLSFSSTVTRLDEKVTKLALEIRSQYLLGFKAPPKEKGKKSYDLRIKTLINGKKQSYLIRSGTIFSTISI